MIRRLAPILGDIRFAHSIFALPFALIGLLVGTRGRLPDARLFVLVVAAMVLARSAAMGFNRLVDQRFDATNPRTHGRAIPSGRTTPAAMTAFVAVCSFGFVAVAAQFGTACLALAPLVLLVLFAYSLTKRFTAAAHAFVGLALALSPPAAYLAARGQVDTDVASVLWIAGAVLLWVAGFDVIYACQDVEHDRREQLHSLPARLGPARALAVARLAHVGMLVLLALAVHRQGLGALSWAAVALVGLLLAVEHGLVRGGDLSRVNSAFFTVNGIVSLLFSGLVTTDICLRADVLWP